MSNTNARAAFPSVIAFSSVGTTGTFVVCQGVTRITPPKLTRGSVDITDMNGPDYYEDSALAGPIRTGVMGFEANFLSTNTQQTIIKDCFESGQKVGWRIVLSGTSYNTFKGNGVVTGYSMSDLTQDGKITYNFEIKTKGAIVGPTIAT